MLELLSQTSTNIDTIDEDDEPVIIDEPEVPF